MQLSWLLDFYGYGSSENSKKMLADSMQAKWIFKSGGSVVKWKDNKIGCEVIGWRKYGDTKLWYEDQSC